MNEWSLSEVVMVGVTSVIAAAVVIAGGIAAGVLLLAGYVLGVATMWAVATSSLARAARRSDRRDT